MASLVDAMFTHAKHACQHAYAPYSRLAVGACLCDEDDRLFSGCNIENAAYPLTLCAETSALAALITAGARKIKALAIVVDSKTLCPPCGACSQRLHEFALTPMPIHLGNLAGDRRTWLLSELLPIPFDLIHLE